MRRFIFFMMFFVICIIPHFSFAAEGGNIILNNAEIMLRSEDEIKGYFILTNYTDNYLPKVSYILTLGTINKFEDGTSAFLPINNIWSTSFEMNPCEERTVLFRYPVPKNLPEKEYVLYLSIVENNFLVNKACKFINLGIFGMGENFLDANSKTINLFNKTQEGLVNGKLNSTFDKDIIATPKISIYKEDSNIPSITTNGEKVKFKQNEDTEFSVKIPEITIPGKYLIKMAMFYGDKQVSNEFEFSYYIGEEIVSIENTFVSLEEVNGGEEAFVNIDFLSKKSVKYDIDYKILKNDGTVINKNENEIELDLKEKSKRISIPVFSVYEDIELVLSVKDKKNTLLTYSIKLNEEKLKIKEFNDFRDVSGKKYRDSIRTLSELGILSGYPDGTFLPDNNITRAEFTTIATKFAGATPSSKSSYFNDVVDTHWAKGYINVAFDNGYVSGYGNGIFKPNNNVTYQEVATILVNILEYPREKDFKNIKVKEIYKEFNVNENIRDRFYNLSWPYNYIEAATNLNIWKGIEETDFSKPATRKDVALMVFNAYFQK